ncbi:unnamed protein product [Sphenostylis stenocarpa]|uniref:Uncharacterized protein n=1 Tax=Sphenostylis stenocarpa TaxID=92480 RepID=A0AA86SCZ5_9FABA|nr:unnamed protein product [Sphenostylis stenocarpa]
MAHEAASCLGIFSTFIWFDLGVDSGRFCRVGQHCFIKKIGQNMRRILGTCDEKKDIQHLQKEKTHVKEDSNEVRSLAWNSFQ